jgi:hypothetical protein
VVTEVEAILEGLAAVSAAASAILVEAASRPAARQGCTSVPSAGCMRSSVSMLEIMLEILAIASAMAMAHHRVRPYGGWYGADVDDGCGPNWWLNPSNDLACTDGAVTTQ